MNIHVIEKDEIPFPPGWEMMKTTEGTTIYLNYEQKKVAFEDPREPRQMGTDGKSKLGSYMFI